MSAAALVNTFFGLHPRNAQVPPNSRDSTTATFQPCLAQVVATVVAAGPVPRLIKSNLRGISRLIGCDTLAQARRHVGSAAPRHGHGPRCRIILALGGVLQPVAHGRPNFPGSLTPLANASGYQRFASTLAGCSPSHSL